MRQEQGAHLQHGNVVCTLICDVLQMQRAPQARRTQARDPHGWDPALAEIPGDITGAVKGLCSSIRDGRKLNVPSWVCCSATTGLALLV